MSIVTIADVERALHDSQSQRAIELATSLIGSGANLARAYYLRGNAHRQQGHWREALNDYLAAIDLDPDGPAAEAYRHSVEVLDTCCHDYFNP